MTAADSIDRERPAIRRHRLLLLLAERSRIDDELLWLEVAVQSDFIEAEGEEIDHWATWYFQSDGVDHDCA